MPDLKKVLYPELIVHNKLPQNLQKEDLPLFEAAISEKIPDSHCWHLQNVLLPKDTVFRSFKIWQEYAHRTKLSFKSKLKRLLLLLFSKRKIEKGIWVTDNLSTAYFHWFADSMSRLIAVSPLPPGYPVLLPETCKGFGYITQSLDLINCPYIFLEDRACYKIDDLILPSHIARTGNFHPEVIRALRNKFISALEIRKPDRKFYISRRQAKTRKLLNEELFISQLKDLNFEIHVFEEYSLPEQVELMTECSILVGLHGAGLTNMLFMQPGTTVIELRKEGDDFNNCYFSMASALDLNYYYFKCKGDHASTQLASFEISQDQIQNLISLLSKNFPGTSVES